ncbi:exodeoxyribonuclease [Corynebacterium renale]|uniref:Exodeoxyribonuclease-3 n=1 Tax=Corynebacterium renale TaxID=1724 RepID=A0A2A9DMJ0_9CORY|nr:exodeoxyribonuclease III [Corynebacterium renale]PFG27140.1 exodeoxyribonuclease-3 [Corynebacterium renale]SQG64129.1 exodeoxyribonuclease [Corynebacterium renale]SQI24036.1 exodeoxyribonuclease [Corynebacterium renale]STC94390.1 exodeoxyribonuclease [Corynebacterium renale]
MNSPLTITSVNVNGVRAATKKRSDENLGMLDWLERNRPDVVLMQEVRATDDQTRKALQPALDNGWHYVGAPAAAKGRAGVGILSQKPLENVQIGFGSGDFEDAGRWIEGTYAADFGPVRVASLYLPSGSENTDKQDDKFRFLDEFSEVLNQRAAEFPDMVIGGDWNICHRREDLKNWKGNLNKVSGFLPDERRFLDSVFGTYPDEESQVGTVDGVGTWKGAVDYAGGPVREPAIDPVWFDVARHFHPDEDGPYTWWTYRGQAFNNNAGWRIDYQAATKSMLERATKTWVDRAESVEMRWSDHAPLNVTYA